MGKLIKIKRGLDISLVGQASKEVLSVVSPSTFAIKPGDFKGLIPKLEVKEGDEVKAGDCLFTDKKNNAICFTSPVSGEVVEVVRGDRRSLQEIRILADSTTSYRSFAITGYESKSRDEIKALLLQSGLWPFIVQRPFGVIADTDVVPKSIHVSGFDSAPLAADLGITLKGEEANLKVGFSVLKALTDGKVYLNLHKKKDKDIYSQVEGVEINTFSGPHPSGLVGVQINKIDPINKGDVVWTIKPQHVAFIGKFFSTGNLDLRQTIVVAGSDVNKPAYYTTCVGAKLDKVLENNIADNSRVISGNVLTGKKVNSDGYLGFYDNQITVIPEGNQYELLGWLFPSYARPTISNTLPLSKFFKKKFKVNTNPHGEPRAYVVTGEYEKVMPMDIMPQQLIKAIMAKDLERMENLGIYEVIEEDMALCEFVCTSKVDVQRVLSEGLELMAEEEVNMKFLRDLVDNVKPTFSEGGKLSFLHSTFDALETFLFVPNHPTKSGAHIRDGIDLKRTMFMVVIALIPALLFGMWNLGFQFHKATGVEAGLFENFWFGFLQTLPLIIVSYGVGLGIEMAFAQVKGHPVNEGFLVSGLLIPMVMPADVPLWMVGLATAFAVVIGKEVFGGTGMNLLNPALTARMFLYIGYTPEMSGDKCWVPIAEGVKTVDGYSGATTLGKIAEASAAGKPWSESLFSWKTSMLDSIIGTIPGSIAETSVIAILLGAIFLIATGIGSWKIMLSTVLGALFMGGVLNLVGGNAWYDMPAWYHLIIGGFMFGTVFMTTDPVSAAQTETGKWIYGFLIGLLTVLIRVFNPGYPEGIMMAILLMNVFAPLIDYRVVQSNIKMRLKRVKA